MVSALSFFFHNAIAWQDHIGGLLTGALLTAAYVYAPPRHRTAVQAVATVAVVALIVIAVVIRNGEGTELGRGLTGHDDDFAAYVARRATLTLDQAEYRLRGPRYKTPSLVKDEILSSRRFRNGLRAVRRGPDGSPA